MDDEAEMLLWNPENLFIIKKNSINLSEFMFFIFISPFCELIKFSVCHLQCALQLLQYCAKHHK